MLDARLPIVETVARFRARATAAGVDLAPADDSTDPLPLAADRLAMERMLGNLVENAIAAAGHDRAGRERAGNVRIAATVERAPDGRESIRIDMLDDGPGFPDGTAARAFERFWRGDPARAGMGSGLGLAIVRELAVAHGGVAHAENQPGGGRASGSPSRACPGRSPRPRRICLRRDEPARQPAYHAGHGHRRASIGHLHPTHPRDAQGHGRGGARR